MCCCRQEYPIAASTSPVAEEVVQVRSSESLEVRSGLKPWMVTGWVVARETRRGKEGSEGATERWRVSERIEMERLRGEEETEILKLAREIEEIRAKIESMQEKAFSEIERLDTLTYKLRDTSAYSNLRGGKTMRYKVYIGKLVL